MSCRMHWWIFWVILRFWASQYLTVHFVTLMVDARERLQEMFVNLISDVLWRLSHIKYKIAITRSDDVSSINFFLNIFSITFIRRIVSPGFNFTKDLCAITVTIDLTKPRSNTDYFLIIISDMLWTFCLYCYYYSYRKWIEINTSNMKTLRT